MSTIRPAYSGVARALHWIVAILVLGMIPAGFVMVQEGLSRPLQNGLFIFHKNTGVLLLVLMLLRVLYRLYRTPADLPDHVPKLQRLAAGANHLALYVLLLVMPVSGYVRVRAGGFPIEVLDAWGVPALVPRSEALAEAAKSVHFYGALLVSLVVAVHLGAALYHGVVRRDGVLGRIWPPLGRARA